jgi:hypothetical protein
MAGKEIEASDVPPFRLRKDNNVRTVNVTDRPPGFATSPRRSGRLANPAGFTHNPSWLGSKQARRCLQCIAPDVTLLHRSQVRV